MVDRKYNQLCTVPTFHLVRLVPSHICNVRLELFHHLPKHLNLRFEPFSGKKSTVLGQMDGQTRMTRGQ